MIIPCPAFQLSSDTKARAVGPFGDWAARDWHPDSDSDTCELSNLEFNDGES